MNELNTTGTDDQPNCHTNLLDLLAVILSAKWLVVGVTTICAVLAVGYVLAAKTWYRAEAILIPTGNASSQGLSNTLSNIGAMGGLTGLLGGRPASAAEPLAVLISSDFTRLFIDDQHLLPILFAEDLETKSGKWMEGKERDWRDGVAYFSESIRSVREDKKTGLVFVAVEWTDPNVAADWANLLIARANDRMRERAILEAQTNIGYLKNELASTEVVALQQSIGHLLENELQKLMLARGNTEFAFRFVDRATAPKRSIRPRRVRIVGMAVVAGWVLSLFIVFARNSARRNLRKAIV